MNKKFILNADDFGMSQAHNQAVLEGYNNGFLTSASLCANGGAFENAIHDVLPDCPDLGISVHLNILEGKSLTKCPMLTNKSGEFNKNYGYLVFNQNNSKLLPQIENEFRAQMDRVRENVKIDHVDSHIHVHAIPTIFEITCKLAKEYGIKYVRTQFEELYFIPKLVKHLNVSYPLNLCKIVLLQYYTRQNKKILSKYDLRTNDYVLGVGYTGMMDSDAIQCGLEVLEEDCVVEALIHPCKYNDLRNNSHTKEFAITQNITLKDSIMRMGFDVTNYKKLIDG